MSLSQVAKLFKSHRYPFTFLAVLVLAVFVPVFTALAQSLAPIAPAVTDDLDQESLRTAIRHSIAYLEKLPANHVVGEQPRRFTAGEILNSLLVFERLLQQWNCPECWRNEFFARFDLLPSSPDPQWETLLYTGYYQPVIEGSLVSTPEYRYPIYGPPRDLIVAEQVTLTPVAITDKVIGRLQGENFVPYYSRREIDELGALRGRGYEIAWAKDPVDLFFLHIQGSGILQLPDRQRRLIGYAGSNGRVYRSIGRLLVQNGKIPQSEISMQRLRRYLEAHPEERNNILAHNESYVFFRFLSIGPLGSLEVPLTPGRSIATDARIFPKGALAFVVSARPVLDTAGQLTGWKPFSRFVLNQDTGSAIRGKQRVDLYFGSGPEAGAAAGFMNSPGKLYFLSLKSSTIATPSER
jgi:membrane-bound lytic murein transglycosylase A